MKKLFLVIWFFPIAVSAQITEADNESLFAFEVKQIDEFFERFNNQETLIKDYSSEKNSAVNISRKDLILSLFNRRDTTLNATLVKEFINQMDKPEHPLFLNFYDDEWFAQVKCSIKYKGVPKKIDLILKIERENDGSKWVIQSANADFLEVPDQKEPLPFLNPISHGTDFIGLDNAIEDRTHIRNYLPASYKVDVFSQFINEWKNNTITFVQVDKITYHFLQIDGWIFTVQNFTRRSKNSGWLISSLSKAGIQNKRVYKLNTLKLSI